VSTAVHTAKSLQRRYASGCWTRAAKYEPTTSTAAAGSTDPPTPEDPSHEAEPEEELTALEQRPEKIENDIAKIRAEPLGV
jgi:hypothetical protein